MSKRIDVEIGKNGELKLEYSGFVGEDCFVEAEALQGLLRELGLWAIPVTVVPKTMVEIEAEVPSPSETRKKVSLS
ncbi:MAG TPA: hypothetical protein GXX23_00655 [Firmicutes bacterium]|nr:hypothetical protein [Candidatus Fermentithermobacillaceae bacterium]